MNNLKTIALIVTSTVLINLIDNLPWWIFLIPIFLIGVLIKKMNWQIRSFWIGFISGFIVWVLANYYFDLTSNGLVLNKVGSLLFVPKIVVLLISGIIGGLCSGLALYTGKSMFNFQNKASNNLA